jgi:Nif-specific regulatory protein
MVFIANRYEIKQKLGSGSLGEVFLAHDRRDDIDICIKVLHQTTTAQIESLKSEFELLTRLDHPGLIKVYDFGMDDNIGPFFTMEYASNGEIGQRLPLAPEQFQIAMNSICAALGYIHNRGVIHGDIKPSNILIDSNGNYRLSDFGLSLIGISNEHIRSSGSAYFMAPEVLRKESISPQSDIYSLSLLLYEMIFGKSLLNGQPNDIISRKLIGEIRATDIPPEYGGDGVAAILNKMLASDPRERFQSMDIIQQENARLGWDNDTSQTATIGKSAFVGREAELEWLAKGAESWIAGQNISLFIGGDEGIGKSRLLDEFRIKLQLNGLRFYRVFCREDDLRPLSPLVKIVDQMSAELDPGMEHFAELGPDLRRLFPERFPDSGPKDLTDGDIKNGRRRMLDNLQRYLGDLSYSNKAVVAIEDIQWADSDTLDFLKLAFGAKSVSHESALFLICIGHPFQEQDKVTSISDNPEQIRVLHPPEKISWQQFISSLLGSEKLPEDFADKLYQETGGNFRIAEEIYKELIDQCVIYRQRGQWALISDWEEHIKIAEGVKTIIGQRINRLNSESMRLAEIAAALGRSFTPDEIMKLADYDESSAYLLNQLVNVGIFTRFTIGKQERMDFAYGQLRRAIYEKIPHDHRKIIHRQIADYYVSRNAGSEFLGYHFLSAGDFDRAYDYIRLSALAAERVFAYGKASIFYSQALKCLEGSINIAGKSHKLSELYLNWGKMMDSLSPSEAIEILSNAVESAEIEGSGSTELAEALIAAGSNYLHIGNNENALAFAKRGLAIAESANNKKLQGNACTALGFVYDKMGALDDAEISYLNALDIFAEIDYPEGSCRVLNYIGIIRKRRGDLSGAQEFYLRALEITLQNNYLWLAMNLYGNLGNLYISQNDNEKALDCYIRSLEISRQISDRRIESINILNIGHVQNTMGNLDAAEKYFLEAIDKQRELGDRGSEAITYNNLGLLYFKKAKLKNSVEHYDEGLSIALEIKEPRIELANLIGLAEVYLAIADFSNTKTYGKKAEKLAFEINDVEQLAAILSIMAELHFELGRNDEAYEFAKKFQNLPEQLGEPLQRARALLISNFCQYNAAQSLQIDQLLEKNPKIAPLVTRFKAVSALKEKSNPEIWLARLDEAIRKAKSFFMPSESWRLYALKNRFLEALGEQHESDRTIERLKDDVAKAIAGFGEDAKANLFRFLNIPKETREGILKMGKVSREERLEVLFRVARTINTIRELDPLLNKIMDLALETLSGERGFIMLYQDAASGNTAERILEPVVARNLERKDILGETTISHSSAYEVARTGKPLLLGRADENILARQSVVDFMISSILCAPLAVKGDVLGIVYVDSRSGSTFNDDDLDFLVSFADLAAIAIENAMLSERLSKKNIYLQKQVESTWGFGNIVGRSEAMQKVFRMAESVAQTDVTVVITGESGTGKELLAHAIHFAGSRKNNRFVPVDCGAMAETLLESELFGYIKGAFTGAASDREGLFEVAEGGTVLLDEISNTSKGFQAKLLRVLQENEIRRVGDNKTRKIDVRVIAATNKNLEEEVKAGNFREDLFYRLNVVNINLPPLREKGEDIPILANYFLEKICAKMKLPVKRFSPKTLDSMMIYDWPGNVRQLENLCERVVIFSKGNIIELEDLPLEIKSLKHPANKADSLHLIPKTKTELKAEKNRMDKLFLMNLLENSGGNVMEASRISGMDRSQIHHLMSRFGLNGGDFKKND